MNETQGECPKGLGEIIIGSKIYFPRMVLDHLSYEL